MRRVILCLGLLTLALPGRLAALACTKEGGGRSTFTDADIIVVADVVSVQTPWERYAINIAGSLVTRAGWDPRRFTDSAAETLGIEHLRARLRTVETLSGRAPQSIDVEVLASSCCSEAAYLPGQRVVAFLRREGPWWRPRWVTADGADGVAWIYDPDDTQAMADAVREGIALAAGESCDLWRRWVLERSLDPATRFLGLIHLDGRLTGEEAPLTDAYLATPTIANAYQILDRLREYPDPRLDQMAADLAASWIEVDHPWLTRRFVALAADRILGPEAPGSSLPHVLTREMWRDTLAALLERRGLVADEGRFRSLVESYAERIAEMYARLK